ncbi:hypothetical protein AXF42_Ash021418 [Apostasia shenzhenica]|uniref:Uncharacterized protein n=1 Tax=Apostasia shenzhenica TaxID=1088818 RepID=A0A2H9ZUC1_9ASPA|nr:hypothetical protein AXF42_Ash021418 [Apostasia shenzhenica]
MVLLERFPESPRRAEYRVLFFHRNARCFPRSVVWGFRRLAGIWIPRDHSRRRKLFGAASTPGIASHGLCCGVFDGIPEQMRGSRETLGSPSNRTRKLQKCYGAGPTMAMRLSKNVSDCGSLGTRDWHWDDL